jgi:hypothetical protein
MKFWVSLLTLLLVNICFAEDIRKVALPIEVKDEMQVPSNDPSIEGKQWNRWTSENFTVCALNDKQAQYLHQHLELVKNWVYNRWGLGDIPFSGECRIICVDDCALFEKLFGIKQSLTQIRRDANGKIKLSVMFLLTDNKPSQVVPIPLTEVCLAEFNQRYSEQWGWWNYRGMALLNGSIEQIRSQITDLDKMLKSNQPIYFGKPLFTMTKDQYRQLSPEKQDLYDKSALVVCLMVRKEFGQDKLQWLLKETADRNDPESVLGKLFNFTNYADFDATFKCYMENLCNDVVANRTPVSYLQIKEK